MTTKFTDEVKQKLLNGEVTPAFTDGRIHFDSIRLRQWRGVMHVEFCYGGDAIVSMECPLGTAAQETKLDGREHTT